MGSSCIFLCRFWLLILCGRKPINEWTQTNPHVPCSCTFWQADPVIHPTSFRVQCFEFAGSTFPVYSLRLQLCIQIRLMSQNVSMCDWLSMKKRTVSIFESSFDRCVFLWGMSSCQPTFLVAKRSIACSMSLKGTWWSLIWRRTSGTSWRRHFRFKQAGRVQIYPWLADGMRCSR